jgi:CheY-like chemotaxis protein
LVDLSNAELANVTIWPDLSGLHVCIIEDNEDTRVLLTDVLQHCGALVTTHHGAESAMADLAEFVPSLFVCDLAMPGIDGLEFVRRLRALPPERGGRLPAIAITAFYQDYAKAMAEEAGFDAYLTKPVKIDDLCRLVRHLAQ